MAGELIRHWGGRKPEKEADIINGHGISLDDSNPTPPPRVGLLTCTKPTQALRQAHPVFLHVLDLMVDKKGNIYAME